MRKGVRISQDSCVGLSMYSTTAPRLRPRILQYLHFLADWNTCLQPESLLSGLKVLGFSSLTCTFRLHLA